jgi:thioredoxin 1
LKTLSDQQEIEKVIRNKKAVMLYFYIDDCQPCLILRPKVRMLVDSNFPELNLVYIDSKTNPQIAAGYGVFANPALLLFFEGREFKRYSKYVSLMELEKEIDRYYRLLFDK